MSMQILSIVLYNHDGKTRTVKFRPGEVNIITGRSRTGKSAIIDIIDYCLGSSRFRVPEGIIKDTVAWYGLLLEVEDGTQVFIAKPTPEADALTQSEAYYEIGSKLSPPPLEALDRNSNDAEIIDSLSRLIGIVPNINVPDDGESRAPLEAHLRHTAFYSYQDQGLVASREVLFHRQMDDFIPQTIKDTLPFFLGIVEEDRISIEHDLRLARRSLKSALRDLAEAEAISSDKLKRGMALIAEAQQVGLLKVKIEMPTSDEVIDALSSVVAWKPSVISPVEDDRAPSLRDEIHDLKESFRRMKGQIDASESYARDAQGYSSEVGEQRMRLQSIHLFAADQQPNHVCPLCSSTVTSPPPSVSELNNSLERLNADLVTVQSERPRLREYIDDLKSKREAIRQQINEKEFVLEAVVAEEVAAEELRNAYARAARVVGRISLYLDTLSLFDESSALNKALNDAQSNVNRLQAVLEEKDTATEERRESVLNRIGAHMTKLAKQLNLEHSEWPFRFDMRHLTVAIDRPGRPISMQRIGGGENFLGCHLATLLSLHKLFVEENRPVPRFLILDQPTQVYFVSPNQYQSLDGTTEETLESNADIEAVRRMFNLLFEFCKEVFPNFQIIILEHANLPEYQDALVEQPWTGDHALIPSDWPRLSFEDKS